MTRKLGNNSIENEIIQNIKQEMTQNISQDSSNGGINLSSFNIDKNIIHQIKQDILKALPKN